MTGVDSDRRTGIHGQDSGLDTPGGRALPQVDWGVEDTVIADGTTLQGAITSGGSVHIYGRLEGEIDARSVTIGLGGRVNGTLKARRAVIHGSVDGNVIADDLRVESTARITGDLTVASSLTVTLGAQYEGRIHRTDKSAAVDAKTSEDDTLHRRTAT